MSYSFKSINCAIKTIIIKFKAFSYNLKNKRKRIFFNKIVKGDWETRKFVRLFSCFMCIYKAAL